MSSRRWPLRPLGDCAKFLSGGTPSKARTEFWDGDIPWVSSGEMTESRIHDSSLHITPEAAEDGSRLVPENKVLAVVRGMSLAKEFRVSITKREVAFNQDLKAFACKPDVDPEFLYYALFAQREHIRQLATEASHGTKKLETDTLARVGIPLPKLPIQQRTVEVACTYDELMENNRRRMGLLENAARLLYEEWFVRLRFPGHEHTPITHGLPKGWGRTLLEEVAEFRLGKMLDQEKNRGDLLPYLANVNVRWGRFDLGDLREMRFEHDEMETFGLKFGDIVMCEGGEPGRCAIWKEEQPGIMIQKALHRIRCREGMNHEYLYQCLRNQGESGQLATLFTGATIKHLPREKLAKVMVVVPPAQLLDIFVDYTRPIENQLRTLAIQNQKLRAARNLLLPRLMSGEIEV